MDIGPRQPYRFVPSRPRTWALKPFWPYIRYGVLGRALEIKRLTWSGHEPHVALSRAGHSLMLTANHPHHADGWSVHCCLNKVRLPAVYVTDYANFTLESRATTMLLRVSGAYSINPHDFDAQSFEQSMEILAGDHSHRAVLFFPEGNIFMHNDVVGTFQRGAFLLALRAARQLAQRDPSRRLYASPVAVKFTHMTDARAALNAVVETMQDDLRLPREPLGDEPLPVLRRLAVGLLNHSLTGAGLEPHHADLDALPNVIKHVAEATEHTLGIGPHDELTHADRALAMRRAYYRRLNEGDLPDDPHLDARLNLIVRLVSYMPTYACDHPTLDRIGEVVRNLYEDLHNDMLRVGVPRAGFLRFAEPIDVASPAFADLPRKQAVVELCAQTQRVTQAAIDQLVADNPYPGGRLWKEL